MRNRAEIIGGTGTARPRPLAATATRARCRDWSICGEYGLTANALIFCLYRLVRRRSDFASAGNALAPPTQPAAIDAMPGDTADAFFRAEREEFAGACRAFAFTRQ